MVHAQLETSCTLILVEEVHRGVLSPQFLHCNQTILVTFHGGFLTSPGPFLWPIIIVVLSSQLSNSYSIHSRFHFTLQLIIDSGHEKLKPNETPPKVFLLVSDFSLSDRN